jgi:hypothetical protein
MTTYASSRLPTSRHGSLGTYPDGRVLYVALPMDILRDKELSYIDKAVALEIWSHNESYQQSAVGVGEALGLSRAAVYRSIAALEARGWMVLEHRYKQGAKKSKVVRWHLQMSNIPFDGQMISHLRGTKVSPTETPSTRPTVSHRDKVVSEDDTKEVNEVKRSEIDMSLTETDSPTSSTSAHLPVNPTSPTNEVREDEVRKNAGVSDRDTYERHPEDEDKDPFGLGDPTKEDRDIFAGSVPVSTGRFDPFA